MSKFKVIAHRRVHKFLSGLTNENMKRSLIDDLERLRNYPLSLREMDVEKIKGFKKTFRIRIGQYRIIFYVDKDEETIYITHVEARKSVYERLS